jgi:hypothetical protein
MNIFNVIKVNLHYILQILNFLLDQLGLLSINLQSFLVLLLAVAFLDYVLLDLNLGDICFLLELHMSPGQIEVLAKISKLPYLLRSGQLNQSVTVEELHKFEKGLLASHPL